jgi:hypothetical protein
MNRPIQKYKVLTRDLQSPYQGFHYELGKWYEEPCIGDPGDSLCVRGFYAGDVESLLYRGVWHDGEEVFLCEVGGRQAGELPLKECWESLRVVRKLEKAKVQRAAREAHKRLGFCLEEALYPVNPSAVERGPVTAHEVELLKVWASMWDSVGASMWASVQNSVWDSVGYSVRDLVWTSVRYSVGYSVRDLVWTSVRYSVGYSVRDSMWAYIGSLFSNVQAWKYLDHAPGVYPFQPAADLWRAGLVPSFDGTTWRLHTGEKAKIVWEGRL